MTSVVRHKGRIKSNGFSKKRLLRYLHLPPNARWDQAAPRIWNAIVRARRNNDDALAAEWSEAKAFLKKRLRRSCACGSAISPGSIRCNVCSKHRKPEPPPKLKPRHAPNIHGYVTEYVQRQTGMFYRSDLFVATLKQFTDRNTAQVTWSVRNTLRILNRQGKIRKLFEDAWGVYEPVIISPVEIAA